MCRILILFITMIIPRFAFPGTPVEIHDAWINEAPPTVKVLAGYLNIRNNTEKTVVLTGIESSVFERIEFHLTEMNDGVAKMQKQDEIIIPAHSVFSFSPGEYHLMLFNPEQPVKTGDLVPLEISFSNGEIISITAEVKRAESMSHHH